MSLPPENTDRVRRAVDRSLVSTLVLSVLITGLYVLSPVDLAPDVLPVVGQADDLIALLLGGGSTLSALLRLFVGGVIRDPARRRNCLLLLLALVMPVLVCGVCSGLTMAYAYLRLGGG